MVSNRGTKVFTVFSTFASDPTFQSWWNNASTSEKKDSMEQEFGFDPSDDAALMDAMVDEGSNPWDLIQQELEHEIGTVINYSW